VRRAPSLVLGASLLLSGCSTIEYFHGEERLTSLQGKPLEEIRRANDMVFHDGRLIVSNSGSASGVAVIDTGTNRVVEFYQWRIPPLSLALDDSGRLFAARTTPPDPAALAWIDLAQGQAHDGATFTASGYSSLAFSGGRMFLVDTYGYKIRQLTLHNHTIDSEGQADFTPGEGELPLGVAASSGKIFVSHGQSRYLTMLDSADLANPVVLPPLGTVDLSRPGDTLNRYETYTWALTAWHGYVFAAVGRQGPLDTGYVAVIHAATGALVKTIPLNFRHPRSASVRNGVWYVCGPATAWDYDGNPVLDGGVEAIDLTAQTNAGIVVTEQSLGGNIGGFAATGPGTGYAIYTTGDESEIRRIRKVSF
jgi:hypothetical protein